MLNVDIENLARQFMQDDENIISPEQMTDAISLAVTRLNQDKPFYYVEDVVVSGSDFADLPTQWQQNFSKILQVEFPIGQRPRCYLEDVTLYQQPDGYVLDLPETISGTLRITFSVRHQLSATDALATTISKELKEPLASYVAGLLCEQMATKYSHDTDSGLIGADSVDHGGKTRKFRARSKELFKKYEDFVGVEKPKEQAGCAVINWDSPRLNIPRRRGQ